MLWVREVLETTSVETVNEKLNTNWRMIDTYQNMDANKPIVYVLGRLSDAVIEREAARNLPSNR